MKKRFTVILLLSLLLCLTACGGSGNNAAGAQAAQDENAYQYDIEGPEAELATTEDDAMAEANAMTVGDETGIQKKVVKKKAVRKINDDKESKPDAYHNNKVKLIRRATLSLETREFDAAVKGLEALVESQGGYIENSDLKQGSYGSTYRSASYTVRVPSAKYDAFLKGVSSDKRCHLVDKNESTEDVGQVYFDTETRLKTLRTKLKRLQELLKQAEKMEDIIELEDAIGNTEYEIDNYTSTLNRYDSLVGYSTFNISLTQVEAESDTNANPYGTRLVNAFRGGMRDFWHGIQNLLLWLAANVINLILLALLILLIRFLVRRVRAKKRAAGVSGGKKRRRLTVPKKKEAVEPEKPAEEENSEP